MIGAIIGDSTGSYYEFSQNSTKPKYDNVKIMQGSMTDDSILSLAVAEALFMCKNNYDNLQEIVINSLKRYTKAFPLVGFGAMFSNWVYSNNSKPYNSFGNGAAMRISAVGYFASSLEQCKKLSYQVTAVTHNHHEAIKGAESVAVAIWMLRHKATKEEVINYIKQNYYNLDYNYDDLVKNYRFDVTCQGTVPVAFYIFSIANSFEDAIRKSITLLGDADTLTCIVGTIAEAYYPIPQQWKEKAIAKCPKILKPTLDRFIKEFQT